MSRDAYLRAGKVADLAKMLEQTLHGDGLPAAEGLATRERLVELYVERLREPEKAIVHVEELLRVHPDKEAVRKAKEGQYPITAMRKWAEGHVESRARVGRPRVAQSARYCS